MIRESAGRRLRAQQEKKAMHDLVIRGATVVDGLGHDPIRADVAVAKGRIAAIGDFGNGRGRDDRCRRPRVDAGHHRYTYPLRRASDLGPNAVAVALPRCHDRCDRELRVRHRAFASPSARPDHAQSRGRRRHGPRRPARRHRLAVRVLLPSIWTRCAAPDPMQMSRCWSVTRRCAPPSWERTPRFERSRRRPNWPR